MFKHLLFDEWVNTVPMITFGLTAFVFFTMMIRAFVMTKDEVDHMAKLPVEDETSNQQDS